MRSKYEEDTPRLLKAVNNVVEKYSPKFREKGLLITDSITLKSSGSKPYWMKANIKILNALNDGETVDDKIADNAQENVFYVVA